VLTFGLGEAGSVDELRCIGQTAGNRS